MPAMPRVCSHCNAVVPEGHLYCGRCGSKYAEDDDGTLHTLYYSPMQAPGKAKLILIRGDAVDGMSFHLNATHHRCGRGQGAISFEDPYVSPHHADFYYEDNHLFLRDEGSTNGTLLKIRQPTPRQHGDIIRAGDHFFRFEHLRPDNTPSANGTQPLASPDRDVRFRLVEVLEGGYRGTAYASPSGRILVGREGCDMSFPKDLHLSKRHFVVAWKEDGAVLEDLDSRNGTFIRVRQDTRLESGDYLFIGQQFLRVEISH